ncbi:MAG: class I SAM-dependent methyltransferase [Halolamina sp.]
MTDEGDQPSRTELYDLRYDGVDRGDVSFYVDRAVAADGPVLELACGTGRVHLPLLRAGVDADGVDLDREALGRLRAKAAVENLAPSVRVGDMTDLTAERAYDLIVCPFNALQHATTPSTQRATLAGVHDALAPGGRFVFDVFVPSFDVVCETYGEWSETTVSDGDREHRLRERTAVTDEVTQQFTVETEVLSPDGEVVRRDAHDLAMLPAPHVELLAELSPFADRSAAGGFGDEPLIDGDAIQVWTLTKADD